MENSLPKNWRVRLAALKLEVPPECGEIARGKRCRHLPSSRGAWMIVSPPLLSDKRSPHSLHITLHYFVANSCSVPKVSYRPHELHRIAHLGHSLRVPISMVHLHITRNSINVLLPYHGQCDGFC